MAKIDDNFWPASLTHLTAPYLKDSSEYVTIGEISSEPVNGFSGTTLLYTAMVPAAEADECLTRPGGIGHGISHLKGQPVYSPAGGNPNGAFWVDSRRLDLKRYQALVESWQVHDRHILLPFNGILQHYGLSPAVFTIQAEQTNPMMAWHDLSVPTYDVVRVVPLSVYKAPTQASVARVEILREYLEDYLLANECVAFATQWEGRYSTGDPAFDSVVGKEDGLSAELKGREVWLKRVENVDDGDQWSDTWCTRLVMKPTKALDSDQVLEWPDHQGPIVGSGLMSGFGIMEKVYVRDEVLLAYENRPEFDIHPETGMVGNGTWWSVSYCWRVGRDHIAIELRKLYEGTQFQVIKHYAQFAVKESSVPVHRTDSEKRNIGVRARDVVNAYLSFTKALEAVCDAAGLPFTAEEIGALSEGEIKQRGWWSFSSLGRLGNVSPLTMTYPQFLSRCKDLFVVLEGLKPAPLRALLMKIGLTKNQIKEVEGLKASAYVCQLAAVAQNDGWSLLGDSEVVLKKWDKESRLTCYNSLFALNGLRMADAHASSSVGDPQRQESALKTLGIDSRQCNNGWGLALDRVYDQVAKSLEDAASLLQSV
jgi:hypothetical protein